MKRRAFLLASTIFLGRAALAAAGEVTVIYIGGWDCPPCRAWHVEQRPKWLASDLHARVRYVEIDAPHFTEAYQERYWPAELRGVLAQIPRKSGAPRFLVVKNGRIVANDFGTHQWAHTLDAARKALG